MGWVASLPVETSAELLPAAEFARLVGSLEGKASPRLDLVLRVLNELQITLAAYAGDDIMPDRLPVDVTSPIDIDDIAETGLVRIGSAAARSVKPHLATPRMGTQKSGKRT